MQAIGRAGEAVARGSVDGVRYQLRYPNGGDDPEREVPWSAEGTLDCSGFVCWCIGIDRVQPEDQWPYNVDDSVLTHFQSVPLGRVAHPGYVNTDSMVADALGSQLLFQDATKTPYGPVAGDIIVYPSYRNWYGRKVPGHVGLLVGGGMVAHCSASGRIAIKITKPTPWYARRGKGTMWLRFKGYVK